MNDLKEQLESIVNKYKFMVIDDNILNDMYNEIKELCEKNNTTIGTLYINNRQYLINSSGVYKYDYNNGLYIRVGNSNSLLHLMPI